MSSCPRVLVSSSSTVTSMVGTVPVRVAAVTSVRRGLWGMVRTENARLGFALLVPSLPVGVRTAKNHLILDPPRSRPPPRPRFAFMLPPAPRGRALAIPSRFRCARTFECGDQWRSTFNQMSIRCQSDVNQMSIRCQSDVNQMSIRCLSDVYQMSIRCLSDVYQMSIRCNPCTRTFERRLLGSGEAASPNSTLARFHSRMW